MLTALYAVPLGLHLEAGQQGGQVIDTVQTGCHFRICDPHRLGHIHRPATWIGVGTEWQLYAGVSNPSSKNNNALQHRLGACNDSLCLPARIMLSIIVKVWMSTTGHRSKSFWASQIPLLCLAPMHCPKASLFEYRVQSGQHRPCFCRALVAGYPPAPALSNPQLVSKTPGLHKILC